MRGVNFEKAFLDAVPQWPFDEPLVQAMFTAHADDSKALAALHRQTIKSLLAEYLGLLWEIGRTLKQIGCIAEDRPFRVRTACRAWSPQTSPHRQALVLRLSAPSADDSIRTYVLLIEDGRHSKGDSTSPVVRSSAFGRDRKPARLPPARLALLQGGEIGAATVARAITAFERGEDDFFNVVAHASGGTDPHDEGACVLLRSVCLDGLFCALDWVTGHLGYVPSAIPSDNFFRYRAADLPSSAPDQGLSGLPAARELARRAMSTSAMRLIWMLRLVQAHRAERMAVRIMPSLLRALLTCIQQGARSVDKALWTADHGIAAFVPPTPDDGWHHHHLVLRCGTWTFDIDVSTGLSPAKVHSVGLTAATDDAKRVGVLGCTFNDNGRPMGGKAHGVWSSGAGEPWAIFEQAFVRWCDQRLDLGMA